MNLLKLQSFSTLFRRFPEGDFSRSTLFPRLAAERTGTAQVGWYLRAEVLGAGCQSSLYGSLTVPLGYLQAPTLRTDRFGLQ
jgi:hypothetical protein